MNENRRPAMANWGYQSLGPGFIQAAYHSQEYLDRSVCGLERIHE